MWSAVLPNLFACWTLTVAAAQAAGEQCDGAWEMCGLSTPCERGHYCMDGVKLPCPAGRFGTSAQETSPLCSDVCPSGFFCSEGSASPTPCGNSSVYCPAGVSKPAFVAPGNYTLGGSSAAGRTAEAVCPKGRYCEQGTAILCPAGTFGEREGLKDASCTDPCPAGWFCPVGTVHPFSLPCGGPEHYCPEGSRRPLPVARGNFAKELGLDPAGGEGGCSAQARCPVGRYCVGGVSSLCPAGRFGASMSSTNSSCTGLCRPGHFCPEGSHRADQHVCGNASVFCPEGASAPQAASEGFYTVQGAGGGMDGHPWLGVVETRTAQVKCEPGHYCVDGVRFPCPPGYFGSSPGLTTPTCSGSCAAGYLCGSRATSPTEMVCGGGGDGDLFCPEGSSAASKVSEGYYTVGLLEAADAAASPAANGNSDVTAEQGVGVGNDASIVLFATRSAERLCEPGFWCEAGFRHPCEAGSYGAEFGATRRNCSGVCAEGFVCGNGSVSAEQRPCGDPSLYCPGANSEPIQVSAGFYSVGGGGPNTRTGQALSPPGSYANEGILCTCAAGRYGESYGLSSPLCSGSCSKGFFCPPGSVSPREWACGGPSLVCPAGSGWPIVVDEGYYTTDFSTVPYQEACPPGLFRNSSHPYDSDPTRGQASAITTAIPLPPCQLCPEGTFKAATGDSLSLCLPCEEHTAESIEARTSCVCQRIAGGDVSASTLYFNTTTATCQNVTGNSWPSAEAALVESTFTRYVQMECEPGHFCVDGARFPCPGGRYGASTREVEPLCQGQCAGGWYCPEASVSSQQVPCGAANLYCPAGSAAPLFVDPGYFATGDYNGVHYYSDGDKSLEKSTAATAIGAVTSAFASNGNAGSGYRVGQARPDDRRGVALRSGVALCPAGWYCTGDGTGSECPGGVYGSEMGLSDPACSGVCTAGFFCPKGSTSPFQRKCGGLGLYCPARSSIPSEVLVGHYGTYAGVEADLQAARDPRNETHSAQVMCEPGFYCEGGRKERCPAGTFLWSYGESSRDACAPCKAGYYCSGENASPSVVATLSKCGSPTVYCPEGSVYPAPVRAGFYSVGGGADGATRVSQVRCEVGCYCKDGVRGFCPSGTYGASVGLQDRGCTGPCPAGAACPEGTVDPTPCDEGLYAAGGAVACNACPGKRVAAAELSADMCRTSRSCCA